METETSKRSSEIVMSVAEGIHLQLQNVQSQMQKDVGKLTSLSKLKRKRLETRFQEQQEQLKLIHEKFKDEINQHIQDCRSSIEGLEVHQIELKRNVERQKASHQKLLLQVEEAIEIQLNDAQQRITAIHKASKRCSN
uniref:Meiosis-specific protein ASY3-like coiled-coil domain-containing protein n=1 Tax=Vitis vinifera TaxID=29760 RepID=F6HZF6_VITVI